MSIVYLLNLLKVLMTSLTMNIGHIYEFFSVSNKIFRRKDHEFVNFFSVATSNLFITFAYNFVFRPDWIAQSWKHLLHEQPSPVSIEFYPPIPVFHG